MVIKVRLIKPKGRQSHSFYKTSQIKFQSISTPSLTKFRMRSTQKLIQFRNPWQQLNREEVVELAQRLEDRPQDLYDLVKQNQARKKEQFKAKFNRITFTPIPDINNLKLSTLTPQKQKLTLFPFTKKDPLQDKLSQNRLLNRIKEKRLEYELQMKNMMKDKRLILETDLPKINKIKAVQHPSLLMHANSCKSQLPLWKAR